MDLLRFNALECHYGAREIFSDLAGVVTEGERIGLVGTNGAGKSSLLRLLAGVDIPFGGTVIRAKDARLGYHAQSVADETEATLAELVDGALARTPDEMWGEQNKRLRAMLDAFGFQADDYARPLREFSGGQRAKASLAHLLIDEPEYLILDEPTNHLDIATVRWLERFIAADKRTYVIVSHDRYFLDRVATRIWEVDRGKLHCYPPAQPAYRRFMLAREARLDTERIAYESFIADRDKRRSTIAGLRATHTSSDYAQVRSRERQLARVEATLSAPPPAAPVATMSVRLNASRRGSNAFAFEVRGLTKAYSQPLFSGIDVDVLQGARLAVVGPNGVGKSTLLKILANDVAPDAGSVRFNPAARAAYFAQSAPDQLDVNATAVEALLRAAPISPQEARALLGRMRISGEAADKPIRAFSGGERRRIMLAQLMAGRADVLLLDEPTNDLDIESRDALEAVLGEYAGTLVIVSHDRYLLDRLCERVLWIEAGAWGVTEGGYAAYEAIALAREELVRRSLGSVAKAGKDSRMSPLKARSQLLTRITRLEREIDRLDSRKAQIEALFAQVETYTDPVRVASLKEEDATIALRSAQSIEEWDAAVAELEAGEPVSDWVTG